MATLTLFEFILKLLTNTQDKMDFETISDQTKRIAEAGTQYFQQHESNFL